VVSDAFKSHVNFKDYFTHFEYVEGDNPEDVVTDNLPWVHIVIGECGNAITAVHKNIDRRYLQLYLNEYCWKLNRRHFRDSKIEGQDLFDKLLNICAKYTSDISGVT